MTFFLSYNATDNLYVGEWKHGNEVARYEYNPRGYKYYRDFVMECASFPLEKVSFYLFSKNEFPDVFGLTYHPALDEYCDFSSRYLVFSSERLSGNRNLFLIDRQNGELVPMSIYGSSEYFPRISPDERYLLFQGSLHGNWNIYYMPLSSDYSKKIQLISRGRYASYNPNWIDNNTVVYVQEDATSNHLVVKDLTTMKEKTYYLPFDWVFAPVKGNQGIVFVGLKESNFGIYELLPDGTITVLEDSPYNEFDPDVFENYLIFSSNRDGVFRIYAKDLVSGKVWCLTENIPYDAFYPAFSEDGKLVAFSVYSKGSEPDIWIVRFRIPQD
jgi:Tol biopolymer transport system component